MSYSSQTLSYSSTPHGNEIVTNVRATEFPKFSTQMTLGSMNGLYEVTPNTEDSTSTHRKSLKWRTAQNLVLLNRWIKYRTYCVVGRSRKGDEY